MRTIEYDGNRLSVGDDGTVFTHWGDPVKTHRDKYERVSLGTSRGRRGICVHILVARAFLGPKPDGHVIRHLDGNAFNNHPSNLAYVPRVEVNRASLPQYKRSRSDMVPGLVQAIRRRYRAGERQSMLAKEYGLSSSGISAICRRASWAWVPD